MRIPRFIVILVSLVAVAPGFAVEFSDIYARLGQSGVDRVRNTGLTIFPTLLIPAGGRFEAMGQAYTAVASDASFLDANPAASASLSFTELTFVHNNWIADTSIEGVGYARRIGDFGFGVGGKFLHVPFTEYTTTTRQGGSGRYSEGTVGVNASYNFLRSFVFPGVSVGATLKAAYRMIPEQIAAGQSAVGVAADIGLLSRFDLLKGFSSRSPNFGAGLALRNFGPPVRGEPLPSQIVTGVAYSPIRPVTVATDLIVPVSLAPGVPAERVGGAAGMSVRVAPFFSVQSGMLLRWGGSRFSMGASLELADFSLDVNYTLDLATQFRNLDRVSVQARVNFGDEGRKALRDLVDRYYLDAWRASAIGNLNLAIEKSARALELDPGFTPAEELLAISLLTRALQEDLRAIDLDSIADRLEDSPDVE